MACVRRTEASGGVLVFAGAHTQPGNKRHRATRQWQEVALLAGHLTPKKATRPPARMAPWAALHTGIGPYGLPFFFNFDAPGSWGRQRAPESWGEEAFSGKGATHKAFADLPGADKPLKFQVSVADR